MLEREEDRHDAALQEAGPQVDQPKAVARRGWGPARWVGCWCRHARGRLRCWRRRAIPASGPGRLVGRGPGRRPVLGPGRRPGQRRGGLAPPVLDRAAGHRRHRPGAARLEQLRPRRGRVDGPLRRLHPAVRSTRSPGRRSPCTSTPGSTWSCRASRRRRRSGSSSGTCGTDERRSGSRGGPVVVRQVRPARRELGAQPPAHAPGDRSARLLVPVAVPGRASCKVSCMEVARS
jgi:hypothetical protein